MINRRLIGSLLVSALGVALLGHSNLAIAENSQSRYTVGKPFLQRSEVRRYILDISQQTGLDRHYVAAWFVRAVPQQGIINSISRPAERGLNWAEYRKIFINNKRIAAGKQFVAEHRATLEKAAADYGVPAELIAAIIGVETYYGRLTGKHRAMDALATLAFDYPPRSAFFKKELTEFLHLAAGEGWDPLEVKGSYAAAMGMPQFISSSYRAYAVDFDRDGKRDLWNSVPDVIGSVANYIARHGWVTGKPVVEQWLTAEDGVDVTGLVRRSLKPAIEAETIRKMGFPATGMPWLCGNWLKRSRRLNLERWGLARPSANHVKGDC